MKVFSEILQYIIGYKMLKTGLLVWKILSGLK